MSHETAKDTFQLLSLLTDNRVFFIFNLESLLLYGGLKSRRFLSTVVTNKQLNKYIQQSHATSGHHQTTSFVFIVLIVKTLPPELTNCTFKVPATVVVSLAT